MRNDLTSLKDIIDQKHITLRDATQTSQNRSGTTKPTKRTASTYSRPQTR